MRAVIAAGGTAGHINPALAIADEIMRREPQSEIVFMGRQEGMEQRLVTARGYRLAPIDVRGFMRGFTWKKIKFNAGAVRRIFTASAQARAFLRSFKPDAVIGCGGYVSGPVVREAAKLGVPVHVLIRPRFGDFLFTEDEKQEQLSQIRQLRALGAHVEIRATRGVGYSLEAK